MARKLKKAAMILSSLPLKMSVSYRNRTYNSCLLYTSNASRKEHRNKDLAEMEVVYQAGSHASRVGALVCCLLSLLSSVLAHTMIYSPWVIYFSIIATQWLVRFIKMKRKSDLVLTVLFFVLSILAFVGFVSHLLEVRI